MNYCNCTKPQYARFVPVALSEGDVPLLEKYRLLFGQYVCFTCGGISHSEPDNYMHVSGSTVAYRLLELDS